MSSTRLAGKLLPLHIRTIATVPIQAKGNISFYDNHFDENSGLIFVRGKVANSAFQLRAGQSVTIQVPVTVCSNALVIPQKAVRHGKEGPYVLVVQEDQTIAKRLIALGEAQNNDVIVCEGLVASEAVVTEGHLRLAVGTRVKITP